MASSQIKTTPFRVSYIDIWIFNWDGKQTGFGFDSLPANHFLRTLILQQVPGANTTFKSNFINYSRGELLCVNTEALMNKSYFTSPSSSQGLRFTAVKMPAEFVGLQPAQLSSPYSYGERIRTMGSFETPPLVTSVNQAPSQSFGRSKVLVYRDANIKGRSKGSSGSVVAGAGIGVWS
jgi:hypothetical protein